jgi:hypothetical protein
VTALGPVKMSLSISRYSIRPGSICSNSTVVGGPSLEQCLSRNTLIVFHSLKSLRCGQAQRISMR